MQVRRGCSTESIPAAQSEVDSAIKASPSEVDEAFKAEQELMQEFRKLGGVTEQPKGSEAWLHV